MTFPVTDHNSNAVPPSHIQTHSGRHLNPFDPTDAIDHITIDDIAHALSHKCRFTGHTREFYSVAQHSVHVAESLLVQVNQVGLGGRPVGNGFARWSLIPALMGLLHDASEAYLPDVASPLKRHLYVRPCMEMAIGTRGNLYNFQGAETELQAAIYRKFGLTYDDIAAHQDAVHAADITLLATERRDLMTPTGLAWGREVDTATPLPFTIHPWSPARARAEFLREFEHLTTLAQQERRT